MNELTLLTIILVPAIVLACFKIFTMMNEELEEDLEGTSLGSPSRRCGTN